MNESQIIFEPPLICRIATREIDITRGTDHPFMWSVRLDGCRECDFRYDYAMKGAGNMKYILMMTGTKAGVDTYRAWSKKDIETHMAWLHNLNKELSEAGEFVANERLTPPEQAEVVRAGNGGIPITAGVFTEAKEFLLGYWIVDVEG